MLAAQDAPQKPQRPKDAAALFRQFAAVRGMSASYSEEKHLSLLAAPLTSSGKLYYMTDADGNNGRLVRQRSAGEGEEQELHGVLYS